MEETNYDFSSFNSEGGEGNSESDSSASLDLIRQSPFGVLLDIPNSGIKGPEDIFGNVGGVGGGQNPFGGGAPAGEGGEGGEGGGAGGGAGAVNPFAGDNFWDIFAGGVNPNEIASNNFGGGFGGGGIGGGSGETPSFGGGEDGASGSNFGGGFGGGGIGGFGGGGIGGFGGGGIGGGFGA